ncbi:hypothetical protein [Pantoea stewartii]|uniref:hypothetical protein n=1 Tax=Pantoea stewartii TaxID=66269 RepID=UPI00259FF58F|nr:hypothetical protein [Pantoea stewartii]
MVEAQVKFAIVAHHSRLDAVMNLKRMLNAHFLLDDRDGGANANHRRAIEWASMQDCRVVILEDDAVLVNGFIDKVSAWLSRFPDDLLSFYLGTGRPPQYQREIAGMLVDADRTRADYLVMSRLIHGVCYSLPQRKIPQILERWDRTLAADYAVGDAYGGRVIYPCYSLVDHADLPTVERHPDNEPRTERRRAWRLA